MELADQAVVIGADEPSLTQQGLCSTRFARAIVGWMAGLLLALALTPAVRAQGVRVGDEGAVGIERAAEGSPRTALAASAVAADAALI